jgi:hypothetical protein
MAPLVPFASPRDVLTLAPGATDDLARLAVERASGRIRDHVRWPVDYQEDVTYERLYRRYGGAVLGGLDPALGSGSWEHQGRHRRPCIILPTLNLVSVDSIVVDGVTLTANQWDATTSGIVYLYAWPSDKATVTYSSGFVRSPEDKAPAVFRDVCLDMAVGMASNPERLMAYAMGGDSERFGNDVDLTDDHRLDTWTVEQ